LAAIQGIGREFFRCGHCFALVDLFHSRTTVESHNGYAFKGSSVEYYGRQYREILARSNIELELRETAGAVENVKLLQDPKSGVQIALVVGGVSDGKHAPGLLSLGTVYNNPYWIFYSSNEPFERLSQLIGKRIAVGPVGSGTRAAAEQILGKAGVNYESATLLPFGGLAAVEAMNDGKVDAVWIFGAPDSTAVHSFLHNPNVRIMGFQTAEAFTRIFPELARLVLPQGVVDIYQNIPPNDVPLIGSTTKVLVRSDLHPEIVQLLLQTMVEAHGGANVFQRAGEFPKHGCRISRCACGYRFLQKRSIVYAEAFASMVVRPCTKSDCCAGHRYSAGPPNVPLSANGLQLDHASASFLLVCPTQEIGSFVRR
jgi:TRAP-type uncharacterized transport system substrate-binding protein